MQTHLNSCPVCQAEVRELEPVVAALADAAPDRIDEDPWPPGDLEELTLAPILGEIHRARRRSRGFQWSALAAAAVCVVAIGLAGLAWPLEPALSLESHLQERLSFSGEAPSMEVEGNLIAHAWGTEIRIIVSGMRDVQTHRVTLVSEGGERVNAGTFIGVGEKPLSLHLNAALLREDAAKLEVRTPGGELVCFDKLPEEPRVALFGIFPWPDQGPQNESTGPSAEDPPPPDTPEKPKDDGSGSGTPHKGSSPESNDKGSSSGAKKPRSALESSEPGRGPHEPPPPEQSPPCDQYKCQP